MEYINKLIATADSESIIKLVEHMLPKVEGEGKSWQEKALNLWRSVVTALCYMRDNDIPGRERLEITIETIIDYLSLEKIQELYMIGYEEAQASTNGEWSEGFSGVKTYLESRCPGYKVERLLVKHGKTENTNSEISIEQDLVAYEQHVYRSSQLSAPLNLLHTTWFTVIDEQQLRPTPQQSEALITLLPNLENTAILKSDKKHANTEIIPISGSNILTIVQASRQLSIIESENIGKMCFGMLRIAMNDNLKPFQSISIKLEPKITHKD